MSSEILSDKKILYIVKTLNVGGAERYTFNLCNYFVDVFSEVTVFSSGGIFGEELIKRGVKIYNSPLSANKGIMNFFLLKRELSIILKNNHFDIIHCQHRYYVPIIHSLKLKNIKIVYTANNYFDDIYQKFIRADAIVGISPTIFDNLVKTMKSQKGKILTINYGVTEIVNRYPINGYRVGYIGRIIKEKGILELVHAIRILKNKFPDIKLLIFGEGKDKNDVLNLINKYGLQDNIELKGVKINLEEIYKSIKIMVLPSKMNEGLPISILECLINKIVVIATSQGAVKDIIKDGQTGFLIDLPSPDAIAQKLEYVFKNYEQFDDLKNNAYQLVKEEYSLSKMLESYHTLYSKLIS